MDFKSSLRSWPWAMGLSLALISIFIAAGVPTGPLALLAIIVSIFFATTYFYAGFYLAVGLMPFLGLTVSIPTGELLIGQRAFGGSIDVSVGEAVFFAVLIAWLMRIIFSWIRRRDQNWRPRLPLAESFLTLVLAHFASAFSPLLPDPILVAKYSLRPILFQYLAFIALPVNAIRSLRRLVAVLWATSLVGTLAALNGLVAMFFSSSGSFIGRAHPYPIFGVSALGENHNSLGDLLVWTVPFTLALAQLQTNPRLKRILRLAAAFQFLIGLCTFSRSTWIVFGAQIVFLLFTDWRNSLRKYISILSVAAVLILPLSIGMAAFAVSQTAQSSNAARLVLSEIAQQLFQSSPIFGAGAGTFVDRVAATRVFVIDFGDPLDAHGFIQKVAAEAGSLGLLALALLYLHIFLFFRRGLKTFPPGPSRNILLLIMCGGASNLLYQLFDTDYWTGKTWLPIGITLAAITVLPKLHLAHEMWLEDGASLLRRTPHDERRAA